MLFLAECRQLNTISQFTNTTFNAISANRITTVYHYTNIWVLRSTVVCIRHSVQIHRLKRNLQFSGCFHNNFFFLNGTSFTTAEAAWSIAFFSSVVLICTNYAYRKELTIISCYFFSLFCMLLVFPTWPTNKLQWLTVVHKHIWA